MRLAYRHDPALAVEVLRSFADAGALGEPEWFDASSSRIYERSTRPPRQTPQADLFPEARSRKPVHLRLVRAVERTTAPRQRGLFDRVEST